MTKKDIIDPNTGDHIDEYLSPSRVNSFIECPGEWALRYLYKMDSPPATDKMIRGSKIEDYLNHNLDRSLLINPYYENDLDEDSQKIADKLLKKLDILFDKFEGKMEMQKQLTNFKFPIPMAGFKDYEIGDVLFELKTTTRKPTRPLDNHIRQVMIYKGWHPGDEDFKLEKTCIIYGIIKKIPEVHFWISEDLREYFDFGEYSLISPGQVEANHVSMRVSIPSMYHHIRHYQNTGYSLVSLNFAHYRMRGYNPRECIDHMEYKFRLFKDLEEEVQHESSTS